MTEISAKKVYVYPRKDHAVGRTDGKVTAYNLWAAFDAQSLGGTQAEDIKVLWDGMDGPLMISTEIQNTKSKDWMVRVVIPGSAIDTITFTQRLDDPMRG